MSQEEMISVRSTAPIAVQIAPGIVVNGLNHPTARDGAAVTHNVPRAAFEEWVARMGPQEAKPALPATVETPPTAAQPAHELHGMLTGLYPDEEEADEADHEEDPPKAEHKDEPVEAEHKDEPPASHFQGTSE